MSSTGQSASADVSAGRRPIEQGASGDANGGAEFERFAYAAAQDLQEPLRRLAGFAWSLVHRCGPELEGSDRESLDELVERTTQMQDFIEDLLVYARLGLHALAPIEIDCHEVVGAAVSNLRVAIEQRQATVSVRELPRVVADPAQLLRLFENLLSNAVKFCPHHPPEVIVSARVKAGAAHFSVRDNGIGIEPQHQERIFMLFDRPHSRSEYVGTGLGLAICKRIVAAHGGHIWVDSQLGKGSTFSFSLPTTPRG